MTTIPATVASRWTAFSGKRVLVQGLGRFGGGVGVSRWLASQGASVLISDRADAQSLSESMQDLADLDITYRLGANDPNDLQKVDLVIVNPAVDKRTCPFFAAAVQMGIPWTTEINLFCERCPAPVIGVTGTFGKSTTSAMLADAIMASGRRAWLGGNIGRSLLGDLGQIQASDLVVLELSSAQLEDLPRIGWVPQIAVITNLYPHHLDRYEGFEAYAGAKFNMIMGGTSCANPVVVGHVTEPASTWLKQALDGNQSRMRPVKTSEPPLELVVPGKHNDANAECALEACRVLGIDETSVRRALGEFPGLPHRLELVRTVNDVRYINDSKSTSPTATITAVLSFDEPLVLIVGGQNKHVPLDEMARAVDKRCRAIICVGENRADLFTAFRRGNEVNKPACFEAENVEQGVSLSRSIAQPGDAVLFSPGAPSFDAYRNFTQRGDHFNRLVHALT